MLGSTSLLVFEGMWASLGTRTTRFGIITIFDSYSKSQTILRLRHARGMIELHWPAPSMALETNPTIVLLFISMFIILPVVVDVIAATSITNWQEPAATALLLGGQGILALGHFLAQMVPKRQRRTVHFDIPRQDFSGTWMFTSQLARRRLSRNPLSPYTARIGQYLSMKPSIPTWQVLATLFTIVIGFLAFYIGARSSNLWVILFEIVCFLNQFVNFN